jgi:hypothetical protein
MIPAYAERLECLKSLYGWMERQRALQVKARLATGGDPRARHAAEVFVYRDRSRYKL